MTLAMSHNRQLIDTVRKQCKDSTELVNEIKNFIANKIHDIKEGPALSVKMTLIFPKRFGHSYPLSHAVQKI